MTADATHPPVLFLTLGFTGPRVLEGIASDAQWVALREALCHRLAALRQALGLGPAHRLIGLSQLAVGGDCLFTEALQQLKWPQRLLLPQPLDDFLAASGSSGPDFSAAEQAHARALLASEHWLDQRVASHATDRHQRFTDTNLQMARESDVLVCLQNPQGPRGAPGGSGELLQRARDLGLPVLLLTLTFDAQGRPGLKDEWLHRENLKLPTLPESLWPDEGRQAEPAALPRLDDALANLKSRASEHAKTQRDRFGRAAKIIILGHCGATALAVGALLMGAGAGVVACLLVELALLGWGFAEHHHMEHERVTEGWAQSRLCAQLMRCLAQLQRAGVAFERLQPLPLPDWCEPLLRSLRVLQARPGTAGMALPQWPGIRAAYIAQRLDDAEHGQIPYYARHSKEARRWRLWASRAFMAFTALALLATLFKLGAKLTAGTVHLPHAALELLGFLAVVLPVVAVGAMSWSSGLDLQARELTFADMHRFLTHQRPRLANAATLEEFQTLVLETEIRLLGETLTWYSRRAYFSVA